MGLLRKLMHAFSGRGHVPVQTRRCVQSNHSTSAHHAGIPANRVANTKYTPWTFLPKNLFEQFSRFMNAYFLLVACLQLSPTLTPVSPVTTWAPLIFIFALSALKEALDDIQRFRADKEANRRPYTVIRDHALIEDLASEELRVGDLVYIPDNGEFPCDMVLLASSEADGSCYVQTANLDGETDLKPRVALKETAGCRQTAELQRLMVEVQCATPNKHVYEFDAVMRVMGGAAGAAVPATGTPQETTVAPPLSPSSKDWLSLSAKQLLHQGTFLRNTEFIYGMVVYTGRQTKLGMNKQKPRTKWTKLDRRVDTVSRFVFLTQLVLVMIFGVTGNVFAGRMESAGTWWYLALGVDEPQGWTASLIIPIRMLLLMSFLIPISLKVSLDIVKFAEASFINWDLNMYDEATDTAAHASNTAIAEDLGQIDYMFTDKTGTLTDNIMVFKRCSIGGEVFGSTEPDYTAARDQNLCEVVQADAVCDARMFFRCIALCQTVLPDRKENPSPDTPNPHFIYHGSSPDEEALVAAAADLGVVFKARASDLLQITVCGLAESYKVLQVFEFSSDRKRMSILVQKLGDAAAPPASTVLPSIVGSVDGQPTTLTMSSMGSLPPGAISTAIPAGRVLIFTKGADDVIFEACKGSTARERLVATNKHLELFAQSGYRTLCMAFREVPDVEYKEWSDRFYRANTALHDRDARVQECFAQLEQNLTLLGATAIEDRLQAYVPETIKLLRTAGLRIWVLTGDKKTTAIQIATSCNLIVPEQHGRRILIEADANTPLDRLKMQLDDFYTLAMCDLHALPATTGIDAHNPRDSPITPGTPAAHANSHHGDGGRRQVSVIIDGVALRRIMEDPDVTASFVNLGLISQAVICCRVTPHQKQAVVEMVAARGYNTLSVGDGGNDVAMIQKANIGVGIKGREGLQASRAADYSIARFHHLGRLILVHGRYAYKRSAFVALYSFYKSMFLAFIQAMYQYYCSFSGASLFNSFSLSTYNVLFTGLPILFFVLDKDIREDMILRYPFVYQETVRSTSFNRELFLGWFLRAILQSLIAFLFGMAVFGWEDTASSPGGGTMGETNIALLIFSAGIVIQTGTVLFQSSILTVWNNAVIFGTLALFFVMVGIVSTMPGLGMFGSAAELFSNGGYWFGLVVISVAALVPFLTVKFAVFNYRPKFFEYIQQVQNDNSKATDIEQFEMSYSSTENVHDFTEQARLTKPAHLAKAFLKTPPMPKLTGRTVSGGSATSSDAPSL